MYKFFNNKLKQRQTNIMKRVFLVFLVLLIVFQVGCGTKSYPSANIVRDEANTGGNLSFVYDMNERKVYFGGEGEFLQYYSADEMRDLEEGYRVGLKVIAPNEVKNLEDAVLEINGTTYSEFLEKIDGQEQNYFYIYPTFNEKSKEVNFVITWNKNAKPQKYKVILNEKTNFLER